MENNNGRGVFYGVIGVATLVVAMIGATFAYFSAEAGTEGDPIAFNSTSIELTLTQNTAGIKYNLIPVDESLAGFAKGGYVGNNTTKTARDANCIDDDGNEFCSVYELTITNPSGTTAQTIFARMDVAANGFNVNEKTGFGKGEYRTDDTDEDAQKCGYLGPNAVTGFKKGDATEDTVYCGNTNVAFAIFKGQSSHVTASEKGWDVDGAKVDKWYASTAGTTTNAAGTSVTALEDGTTAYGNVAGTPVLGKLGDLVFSRKAIAGENDTIQIDELSQTLRPGGSATYTIVMWLHDNRLDQNDDEGQTFAAGITFSTSLNGSGVTAVLATSQGTPSGSETPVDPE